MDPILAKRKNPKKDKISKHEDNSKKILMNNQQTKKLKLKQKAKQPEPEPEEYEDEQFDAAEDNYDQNEQNNFNEDNDEDMEDYDGPARNGSANGQNDEEEEEGKIEVFKGEENNTGDDRNNNKDISKVFSLLFHQEIRRYSC